MYNLYPDGNAKPRFSFDVPVTPPDVDPDEGDTVSAYWNPLWTPYMLAALDQLILYATWLGTDAERYLAVNRASNLKELIGEAVANNDPTPTPFWDSVTDVDDSYPPGTLTPWYGTAVVTYASPPEVTFTEKLFTWTFAGFMAISGAPGAAIAFLTIADSFIIAFKTGNIGAIIDIIADASHIATLDTYSVADGLKRVKIQLDPDVDEHQIYIVKDDNPDTIVQVVRDELNPDDVTPPGKRYNPDTDTAQIQNPDGTWTDNPAADTRTDAGAQFAPITADDVPCQSASNMVHWIENLVSGTLTVMATASDAGGLLTFLIGLFLELGPFGWLIDIVLTLALLMFSAGITALSAAFTSTVYDQLLDILYCVLDADGKMDDAGFATVKARCASEIGGLANDVLQAMLFVMGRVGLNNAGTVDGGTGFDCSSLACPWCWEWTETEIYSGASWTITNNIYGSYTRVFADAGFTATLTSIEFDYTYRPNNSADTFAGQNQINDQSSPPALLNDLTPAQPTGTETYTPGSPVSVTSLEIVATSSYTPNGSNYPLLTRIRIAGIGTRPSFADGSAC